MYELLIIGGGPAGLAAAVYAARKRLNAVLVSVDIGGQLNWNTGIENYLGYQFITGPELIEKSGAGQPVPYRAKNREPRQQPEKYSRRVRGGDGNGGEI
jgi:thioredoxin reductase